MCWCGVQVAVCNLASISLSRFVTSDRQFNFKQLEYVTGVIVKNLNRIIDVNYYPVPEVCSELMHSLLCLSGNFICAVINRKWWADKLRRITVYPFCKSVQKSVENHDGNEYFCTRNSIKIKTDVQWWRYQNKHDSWFNNTSGITNENLT